MKFEECKIGDEVTLETDAVKTVNYCGNITSYITSVKKFVIIGLNYGTKTVHINPTDSLIIDGYDFVDPSCLMSPTKIMRTAKFDLKYLKQESFRGKIWKPDDKLDFEIRKEKNELAAYYYGTKIATVRCHPDDAYDEEFGLNLLLRRVCQKLKNSHIVVETVEELL